LSLVSLQTDSSEFGGDADYLPTTMESGRNSLTPIKAGGAAHWRKHKLSAPGGGPLSPVSPGKVLSGAGFGSTVPSTPGKSQPTVSSGPELSTEDLLRLQTSEPFSSFVELAGRRMERALAQSSSSFDILHSYTQSGNDSVRRTSDSQILSDLACFECELTRSRPVMDIQFSPHTSSQQGLFLVAYGATGQAKGWQGAVGAVSSFLSMSEGGGSDDSAGVVCLWQAALPSSPEKRLLASSPVVTAQFHAEDQNLIVGGCYNGQVLLWDLRLSSPHPVQRSNLAGKGHRHPVISLTAISSAAAYELVSVSADGQICHWDVQRLAEPVTASFFTAGVPSATEGSGGSSSSAVGISCTVLGLGEGEASKEVLCSITVLPFRS
jgi:WD40 repeat protein